MKQPHQEPWPVALYRVLMLLYPADHRRDYGPLSTQLFVDIYRDASALPPLKRTLTLTRAYADTASSIGHEQVIALKQRLNLEKPFMKKSQKPFHLRHRTALIVSGATVVALGAASILTGFWGYNGLGGYVQRVIQSGIAAERLAGNWNAGWDDVTAFFVNDYIEAHYYGGPRTDVGIKSPHAFKRVYTQDHKSYTISLEENLNTAYTAKDANFDPITCSTQPPTAVHYLQAASSGQGQAQMIAAFSYAGQTEANLVQYNLLLDQSRPQGSWKVASITCLTLQTHDPRPYITGPEAAQKRGAEQAVPAQPTSPNATPATPRPPYEQRNDRVFAVER